MKKSLLIVSTIMMLMSCASKHDYRSIMTDPDTYAKTVYELNTVVMGNNFSPVVASRNYLYANVAAYEVMAAAYPEQYNSLAGQLNGLKTLPKPPQAKEIDFEFASLLAFWKIGQSVTFSSIKTKNYVDSIKNMALEHGMPKEVYDNSIVFAETVADSVMAWSKKDNYLQTRGMPEYTVMMDSDYRWIPTP